MMSVGKVGGGRIWYYETLGREDDNDYYAKKHTDELEREGVFVGTGAERIGTEGKEVTNKAFRNLMKGYDPTGKDAWVQNAGKFEGTKRDRMPAWDITFSAPKSVSIAAALGGDETRRLIEAAHLEAIKETVKELEQKCIVRSGKGGRIQERGGFIAAVFQHGTSRQVDEKTPPDMQLHSHVVVINTAVTQRGKKGAINGLNLLDKGIHQEYGGKYRARLAQKLNAIGFQTEKTKDAFELKGIPAEAIAHFSKRSEQIQKKAPRDKSTAKDKLKAALKTRVAKRDHDPKKLLLQWKEQALRFGVTQGSIEAARRHQDTRSTAERWKEALGLTDKTADALAKAQMTFTKKELQLAATEAGAAAGLLPSEMKKAVGAFITGKVVLRLTMKRDEKGIATNERLYSTKTNMEAIAQKAAMDTAAKEREAENLRNLKRELEKHGYKVMGCAVKNDTVDQMNKAGMKSFTVSRLLTDYDRRERKRQEAEAKKPTNLKEAVADVTKAALMRSYADFQYLTGQWNKKKRDRVLNKEEVPTSELVHKIKRITGQISAAKEQYLNAELAAEKRKIDSKTIVFVNAPTSYREKQSVKRLIEAVEKEGGKVIVAQAQGLEFASSIQAETRTHIKEAKQTETKKGDATQDAQVKKGEAVKQEELKKIERQRTRDM